MGSRLTPLHPSSSLPPVEAIVSEGRLVSFLDAEELQSDARTVIDTFAQGNEPRKGDELISVKNGSFKWAEKAEEPTLQGINLSVKKGELVALLGRVGDGKVSLERAFALVRELP